MSRCILDCCLWVVGGKGGWSVGLDRVGMGWSVVGGRWLWGVEL